MNGLEFCRLLKSNPRTRDIPVIFITVLNSPEEKEEAFLAGAVDFIPKPFERVEVIMRIRNQLNNYQLKQEMENYNRMMHKLVNEQRKQIEEEQKNILFALSKMVEKRNSSNGQSLERIANNSRLLAQGLQFLPKYEDLISDEFIENIGPASKTRDIGDIVVINKEAAGKEDDAWKQHTIEGASMLEEIYNERKSTELIAMAIKIARSHHENWDGTGYPQGLKGEDIPLESRIVSLVEAFDELIRDKNDKGESSVEESIRIINDRKGTLFEPDIVDIFNKVWRQMKV